MMMMGMTLMKRSKGKGMKKKLNEQEILEQLYPMGLSIRRVVDLPNGMKRVSYIKSIGGIEKIKGVLRNNS